MLSAVEAAGENHESKAVMTCHPEFRVRGLPSQELFTSNVYTLP
jgi:hypothetical protein